MKLSDAQLRALKYLVKRPRGEWVNGTPVTQKCLNVLHEKGLVSICYEKSEGGWLEKITDAGRDAACLRALA